MTIGDGRAYRAGPPVYPRTYYPEGTAVPTVCRSALQNAYSHAQYAGRHIGTYVQPLDLQEQANIGLSFPSNGLVAASFRAYIPEHWDQIAAHVVWYGVFNPPQFRIVINSVNGTWRDPDTTQTSVEGLLPGMPPLAEFTFSEDLPTLTLPNIFDVSVEAGGSPSSNQPFGVLLVTAWGVVDGG